MMKEETAKVLEMVQAGQITAQEAQRLLEAMEESEARVAEKPARRKLYVKVTADDDKDGKVNVNLALPLSLVRSGMKVGLKMANSQAKGALDGLDLEELQQAIEEMAASGETGDLVQVVAGEDGGRADVHIYIA